MDTSVVVYLLAALALIATGALALYASSLARRLRRLEKSRDVERRHRLALTVDVERLQNVAAGRPSEPEGEVFGVVVRNLGPRFPQ
ncbi:MAG TPA: hypothetical protein VMK12_17845 [Anaeromyxobacteraceae bacterium]|nr:hypothetical protein [Anaeromyxobacteraceae bacterium]